MKHTQYKNYVSTHYNEVAPANEARYRKRYYVWRSYLQKYLPRSKNSSILEIGCGVGHNLYSLRELGYTNVTGTDYSLECVKICRQKGFSAQIVNDQSEKTFYKKHDNSFDCVVLYDVLEHYTPHDAIALLVSIRLMLKPNGSVIISLPNAAHPLSNMLLFADITHKCIYTPISLSQLIRSSGFMHIQLAQMNSFSPYDDQITLRVFKQTILSVLAALGELFWKGVALLQGIILTQCKPTLIAIAKI